MVVRQPEWLDSRMRSLSLFFVLVLSVCSFAADLNQITTKANAGDPDAQYKLGVMYSTGNGAPQDLDQAFQWFSKAARRCDSLAVVHLEEGHEELAAMEDLEAIDVEVYAALLGLVDQVCFGPQPGLAEDVGDLDEPGPARAVQTWQDADARRGNTSRHRPCTAGP